MSSDSSGRVAFRELVEFAIGGGWGADEPADGATEVRVVRGTDLATVRSGSLEGVPTRFEAEKKVAKRTLRAGDLVLEISGGSRASGQATGRAALVTDCLLEAARGVPIIPASFCRLLRVKPDVVEPEYAFRLLCDMHASGRAFSYQNDSTGISNFQLETFLDAERVWLPTRAEQRAIADILNTFDNKVESNRRLADRLLALAECEFARTLATATTDPSTGSTAVPDGWRPGTLGDLVDVTMGQSPAGSSYSDDPSAGPLLVQGMGGFGERFPAANVFTSAPRKMAPTATLLMTVRAPVGELNITDRETCLGRGVCAVASPFPGFAEFLMRELKRRWGSEERGTIFPAVNRKQIVELPVCVPPDDALAEFEQFSSPLRAQVWELHKENVLLTAIRDELLPRLVSGRLRVRDAVDGVEEAVPA